jgi:formamidopyrimidine-DNA glycosylase
MPEGPEVKKYTDQLNKHLLGSQIVDIAILSGRYKKENDIPGLLSIKGELPLLIESVACKGKFIYWTFKDTESSMWNTLGMTGSWGFQSAHQRVRFTVRKDQNINHEIFFSDIRNFGTIKFSDSKKELSKKLNSIGPDMLSDPPAFESFKTIILSQGHKNICKTLMDQSNISGVGNYVKAESLYLSKLSPHRNCSSLSEKELMLLYLSIKSVLSESYTSGGSTLKTYRDLYGNVGSYSGRFLVYGKSIDPLGNKVSTVETPDGRTTHWVPSIQI